MPMERKMQEAGAFFEPSEVALLQRVFNQVTVPGETNDQRENRASRIIANYMAGITTEDEMVSLSRQPLGR
ncbi:hypothetical protein [Mesorhizobium sp. A556]